MSRTISIAARCSIWFLGLACSSAASLASSSGSPVVRVVPASGNDRTMSPSTSTSSSGEAPMKPSIENRWLEPNVAFSRQQHGVHVDRLIRLDRDRPGDHGLVHPPVTDGVAGGGDGGEVVIDVDQRPQRVRRRRRHRLGVAGRSVVGAVDPRHPRPAARVLADDHGGHDERRRRAGQERQRTECDRSVACSPTVVRRARSRPGTRPPRRSAPVPRRRARRTRLPRARTGSRRRGRRRSDRGRTRAASCGRSSASRRQQLRQPARQVLMHDPS